MKHIVLFMAFLFVPHMGFAEELKQLKNVAYGSHSRQVLDFYQAKSDKPTPVVFYIHGGGWQGGDKKTNPKAFLDKSISVVAINYRYVRNGVEEDIKPSGRTRSPASSTSPTRNESRQEYRLAEIKSNSRNFWRLALR